MERPPVFLVGSPRSGTTWLQQMLGSHPAIATPQELHLFSLYLAPWDATWRAQLPESAEAWRHQRHQGLPAALTAQELDGLMEQTARSVYERVLAAKPGASILLEKCPGYGPHLALILRVFPDARIVHLIRDGRDVAASLRRAARGWGRGWAPGHAERGAWLWRTTVEAARTGAELTPAYRELRFEDLLSDGGPELLRDVLAFAGAPASAAEAAAIYERFRLPRPGEPVPSSLLFGGEVARRVGGAPAEPEGFFGEGRHGTWKDVLGPFDRWSFALEAGALLRELGYERDAGWVQPGVWRLLGPVRRTVHATVWAARFAVGAAQRALRTRATIRFSR